MKQPASNSTEAEKAISFVSYSRRDSSFVEPIVSVMRTAGSNIFFDRTDIAPGDEWSSVIAKMINKAQIVFVFWSKYASQSEYVKNEVKIALNEGKKLVPVLLDNTELWENLARYQWIDFRHKVYYSFDEKNLNSQAKASKLPIFFLSQLAFFVALLIAATIQFHQKSEESLILSFLLAILVVFFLWIIMKVLKFIVNIFRSSALRKRFKKYFPAGYPLPVDVKWIDLANELDSKTRELAFISPNPTE